MTQQALVFHSKVMNPFPTGDSVKASDFETVATVDFDDGLGLDYVYEATNSFDGFWGWNEGVTLYGEAKNGCRSTSVGDLIMLNDVAFRVENFGFKQVAFTNDLIG